MKKKRTRTHSTTTTEEQSDEERGEEFQRSQFRELAFSLSFIYVIIYRPLVFEKFVFLLYNYPFNPPHINHCLFNYFNNMYSYTDDNANATLNHEYDADHPEVKAIFRPQLFNAFLFEALNRILHDPLTTVKTDKSTERSDLIELAELAKKIVAFSAISLSSSLPSLLSPLRTPFFSPKLCSSKRRPLHS